MSATLRIRQEPLREGQYPIRLTLTRPDQAPLEGDALIDFALTEQEQNELRWYLEDYLTQGSTVPQVMVDQIETMMAERGVELYEKMLEGSRSAQRIFDRVLDDLPDLRIEISTGIAEAASIPWELMREPESDSPIALRVRSFVRVQSNPNLSFVNAPPADSDDPRIRLLYVVCRPSGTRDVSLRAVANRLLHDLGDDLSRFEITALRPPTFEQLQGALTDAKNGGRPYHIVHFDGHGIYADLTDSTLADYATNLSNQMLKGEQTGKHGYLLFENPGSEQNTRPVSGNELGKLLRDTGVPVLVLNACQSAMHEAGSTADQNDGAESDQPTPPEYDSVHDEVRAIGSLAQSVIDQGIPAVLGMRYSVYVVTAAQYIGELYGELAKGQGFGQAATTGRKHLHRNPERWVGLQPRPLQDWFVPVVYEAAPLQLLPPRPSQDGNPTFQLNEPPTLDAASLDPVQRDPSLLRYVPDHGFVGRDETLLLLDRAFDQHSVVLLHAYAGQGKTSTAVEFARWYAQTGGLGPQPAVFVTSFEQHTDLGDVLNQIGQPFAPLFQASGIEWHALNEVNQRRDLILQLLRQLPVLWIWDNVEPVAGFPIGSESTWSDAEQTELADFLRQIRHDRATQAKILLTSRHEEQAWLAGIPQRIRMPRMSAADAAKLAQQLGQERNLSRAEVMAWQPLLDYCAGNPLTLRVLAGQAVKMGLRAGGEIEKFVQQVRTGEQQIEDADAAQGRDKSLGASLDYGFKNAFGDDELPIVALLHLFQGTVDVDAMLAMGKVGDYALPELAGRDQDALNSILQRASQTGLLTHLGATWYTIHPALPWFLAQLFGRYYPASPSSGDETASTGSADGRATAARRA